MHFPPLLFSRRPPFLSSALLHIGHDPSAQTRITIKLTCHDGIQGPAMMTADKRWSSNHLRDILAALLGRDSRSFKLRKAMLHSPEVRPGPETLRGLAFCNNMPLHVFDGRPLELDEEALAILPLDVGFRIGLGRPPPPSVVEALAGGRKSKVAETAENGNGSGGVDDGAILGSSAADAVDGGGEDGGAIGRRPVTNVSLIADNDGSTDMQRQASASDDSVRSCGPEVDAGVDSGNGGGGSGGSGGSSLASSSMGAIESQGGGGQEGEAGQEKEEQSAGKTEKKPSKLLLRALEFPPGEDDIAAAAAAAATAAASDTATSAAEAALAATPSPTISFAGTDKQGDSRKPTAPASNIIEEIRGEVDMSAPIELSPTDSCWGDKIIMAVKKNSTVAQVRNAVWEEMRCRGLISTDGDTKGSSTSTTTSTTEGTPAVASAPPPPSSGVSTPVVPAAAAVVTSTGVDSLHETQQPQQKPQSGSTSSAAGRDRPAPGGCSSKSPAATLRLRERDRVKHFCPARILRDSDGKLPRMSSVSANPRLLVAQLLPDAEHLGGDDESIMATAVAGDCNSGGGDAAAAAGEVKVEEATVTSPPPADARVIVVQWWDRWAWRLTEKYEVWISPTETVAAARCRFASQVRLLVANG